MNNDLIFNCCSETSNIAIFRYLGEILKNAELSFIIIQSSHSSLPKKNSKKGILKKLNDFHYSDIISLLENGLTESFGQDLSVLS
jgi:hypothetical protein